MSSERVLSSKRMSDGFHQPIEWDSDYVAMQQNQDDSLFKKYRNS